MFTLEELQPYLGSLIYRQLEIVIVSEGEGEPRTNYDNYAAEVERTVTRETGYSSDLEETEKLDLIRPFAWLIEHAAMPLISSPSPEYAAAVKAGYTNANTWLARLTKEDHVGADNAVRFGSIDGLMDW